MSVMCVVVRRELGDGKQEFTLVRRTSSTSSTSSPKHEVLAACTSPEAIQAAWRLFQPEVPVHEALHEEYAREVG